MSEDLNSCGSRLSPDSLMLDDFNGLRKRNHLNTSALSYDSLEDTSLEISDISGHEDECAREDEDDPMEYLDKEVFPMLLPCFEEMLFAAKQNDVLKVQKSRFNGLDYLAELLWNRNPCHPERQLNYVPIFEIPFVKTYLENNPRPVFPKSWLWTASEAAVVIQSAMRGYFVRRLPQVQEMREFWKILAREKTPSRDTPL
ncbi:IQ domain-containing protein K-like [Homalodisca vitripennis]|uniref:IQ domain-containing protein K-like n=1 Tax=Homalodisca vitripennis TaxID=197043 RepID=UPI001EECBD62|nr:IQ domain-containing protein K-like [Homalodisca vitripennis]